MIPAKFSPHQPLNQGLSPIGEAACEAYSYAIIANQERESATDDIMGAITELSHGFSVAMLIHKVPVERAIEVTYDQPFGIEGVRPKEIGRLLVPFWIAVKDTDLAGREMRHAKLARRTCSYSLLSGTANNFRTEYEKTDPTKLDQLKLGVDTELRYSERAIGITASGMVLPLRRFYQGDELWRSPWETEPFYVSQAKLKPDDVFDTEASAGPGDLIAAWRDRLSGSLQEYVRRLDEECAKGPVERDVDYYFPRELGGFAIGEAAPGTRLSRLREWFSKC